MADPVNTGSIATAATAAAMATHQATIMGIPPPVLLAGITGALFGLAYTKPESWAKLTAIPEGSAATRIGWFTFRASAVGFTLIATAFFMGWLVVIAPHFSMTEWAAKLPPEPLAGVLSFGGLRVIPPIINLWKRVIDRKGDG